jgi:hypothetical protein
MYDISGFGSNSPFLTNSPLLTGASDPSAAYIQTAASSSPGSMSGGSTSGGLNYFPPAPNMNSGLASVIGTGKPGGLGDVGGIGNSGHGFNIGTAQLALGGLQTIGALWNAWQANKLAKQQFNFQKDFANANLANQIKSYNTALEDRSRSRAFTEGQDAATAQAYVDHNRLADRKI